MKQHWLRRPETIRKLWIVFAVVLAATVAAGFAVERHALFGLDGIVGFNAWYGFLACAAMVIGARLIGLLLKRPDSYYDD
jgi:hypothetical protein